MKRTVSFLLTVLIIFSSLPISAIKVNASPFSGGSGSENDPYLVSTPEALDAIRNYPKAHYLQIRDIDMSAVTNWVPLPRFEGVYDGGNYKIINFSLNDNNFKITADQDSVGLFAYLCNADVRNIKLDNLNFNFDLSNHDYVPSSQYSSLLFGGLSATADGSTISNCSVTGNITIKNHSYMDIGGLVGSLNKGSSYAQIENCTSNCNITISGIEGKAPDAGRYIFCGGIMGNTTCSLISNCLNTGNISISTEGHCYVGGIAGSTSQGMSALNCINLGNITGNIGCTAHIGGISGRSTAGGLNDRNNYTKCSNSGSISANVNDLTYIGGIVGKLESNNGRSSRGSVSNSQNLGSIIATVNSNTPEAYIGGIAGSLKACATYDVNYGNITLYSKKSDNSQIYIGGMFGKESWPQTITISGDTVYYINNCYNLSDDISSCTIGETLLYSSDNVGRILGNDSQSTDCYSYKETLINGAIRYGSLPTDKNGGDLTKNDLLLETSYPQFDFSSTWIIDKAVGGAVLRGVPYSASPVLPETPQIPDFDEALYRADHLSSGNMNILTDIATYNLLLSNHYSPSKIIIDAHPENMHTVAAAWEALKATIDAADGKVSSALKQSAKQEDLITAYILGAVGAYTELQYADAVKKNFKHTENLVKIAVELNGAYAAGGEDFKNFIMGKEGDLDKLLADYYNKNDPTMSALLKTKKGISVISSVISRANDIEDLISEISSYSKLYGMNEATKEALLLMYEVCPDEAKEIKSSLKLAAEIINSANEDMIDDIAKREFFFGLNKEASYIATDKLWKYISSAFVDKCPVAKGFIELAKSQMTIVDKMFGIDARTEQYFKLCTLTEIDRIAGLAVNQALINYKDAPTSANASVFLAAIELKFNIIGQDYDEAIKYSEIITDSGMIQKMENAVRDIFGIDNVNQLKESLLKAETAMNALHCTLLTSWISALDAEDHSIAENYYEYRERMYALYHPEKAESIIEPFHHAAKQYSIHCPVNVKILNASGALVAEVGEDKVRSSGEIAVIYDHGEKDIYFFDGGDYKLVCEGFDTGDMDIEITDYDTDGNIIRTVNYNNLPVSSGSTHTLSSQEVSDASGQTIEADYDSSVNAQKYKVTVNNGMIEDYHLEYEAAPGERVEISAVVPDGYRFAGWQGDVEFEDAKAVSTYFFMTDSNVEISAKLKMIEDDDDNGKKDSIPPIVIIIIVGAAIITLSGIAILTVMIKEKSKKRNKEN